MSILLQFWPVFHHRYIIPIIKDPGVHVVYLGLGGFVKPENSIIFTGCGVTSYGY